MTSMFRKFGRLVDRVRRAEATIAARVEGAAGELSGARAPREPLETVHAIVDAAAREIQPAGRGRSGFPYDRIDVAIAAPDARTKARLRAIVEGAEPLEARIRERLRASDCLPRALTVQVSWVAKPRRGWSEPDFDVVCTTIDEPAAADAGPRLELAVLAGRAARTSFVLAGDEIAIGRGTDVCDTRGRLIRTNHVAFTEGADDINQTVSRLHAHITRDAASGAFRIHDDGSAQGTSIVRGGKGYPVPRGARGLTIAAGDEIVLGRARLKVKLSRS